MKFMQNNNPLVSIIIPTFNRAHLIAETLDSVLAQTYENWECIIVDDGSTDNSEEVIQAYLIKDNRFQYHHRPKDRPKGANACRNYGFELSKGAYINWFDSDDLMDENKLKIQVDELNNSNLFFTVCQTLVFVNDVTNIIGLRNEKIHSDDFFNDFITNDIKWLTQAPLIKRIILTQNNLIFDESLHRAQERDFFVKLLALVKDYVFNTKALVLLRKHSNSISYGEFTSAKCDSSFRVNCNILLKYNSRLTKKSKVILRRSLKTSYKDAILLKDYNLTLHFRKAMENNLINFSFYDKLKMYIGYLSLRFMGKGELFFK